MNTNWLSGGCLNRKITGMWIKKYALSGVLSKMPVNQSVYDWAVETGMFTPKSEYQQTPKFIQ